MHLALQILLTAQGLEKAAQRVFRPHGLTPAQFNVLNLLADQPTGLRASALADALIVDRSNITGLLKRMKKDGLLHQVENPEDRREHVVALSPRGRKLWQEAGREYERCLAALDAALPHAQTLIAEKALQQVAQTAANLP